MSTVLGLLSNNEGASFVKVCAPMVRYSKLPFRMLVREFGCDIAYTPMMMSDSFCLSEKSRNTEFITCPTDKPLISQFAANDPVYMSRATELVANFCDGVDINCGCPQKWAMQDGFGSSLIYQPDLISEMISTTKRLPGLPENFCMSIKIRLHESDLQKTVDLCRKAQSAGVDFIAVHARNPKQRNEPPDYDALKVVVDSLHIPVVANGGVKSLEQASQVAMDTGCRGVMCAEAILKNPSIFSEQGYVSPDRMLSRFTQLSVQYPIPYTVYKHHVSKIIEGASPHTLHGASPSSEMPGFSLTPSSILAQQVNACSSFPSLVSFLQYRELVTL